MNTQENTLRFRIVLYQCAALILFSMTIAVFANTINPGGLSWVHVWTESEIAGIKNYGLEIVVPEDAWALYEGGKVLFVDAREHSDFKQRHLPGAMNVPVSDADKFLEQLVSFSQAGVEIITFCDSLDCSSSSELARILLGHSIRPVRVLTKGIVGWYESGFPVEEEMAE